MHDAGVQGLPRRGRYHARDETPGGQAFAETVLPHLEDDTIILANHGIITDGKDLEDADSKTEIIDHCLIPILAKQLGTVNHHSDAKAAELIKLKPSLGIRDVRLDNVPEDRPLQQPLRRALFRLQARAQGLDRQVPGPAAATATDDRSPRLAKSATATWNRSSRRSPTRSTSAMNGSANGKDNGLKSGPATVPPGSPGGEVSQQRRRWIADDAEGRG